MHKMQQQLHRHPCCQVQNAACRARQQSQQCCKRLSLLCKAAQQHQPGTCHHTKDAITPSRRALLASTAALLSFSSQALWGQQPAQAYLVDETAAQSVFALAARSVVSINDYKVQGGGELLEGIGTGFVWDQYGHSECAHVNPADSITIPATGNCVEACVWLEFMPSYFTTPLWRRQQLIL